MPAIKLTSRYVETAKASARVAIRDANTRGLELRLTPAGGKSWGFRYRRKSDGKQRRVTLGDWPMMGLEAARDAAATCRAAVARGEDPAGGVAARKEAATFRELAEDWKTLHADGNKHPRNVTEDMAMLTRHVFPAIGDMRLGEITKRDVVRMLDRVVITPDARPSANDDTPPRALTTRPNRVHALVRSIFRWALGRAAIEINPMDGVKRPIKTEKPRDRQLTPDEIRTLWAALGRAPGSRRSCVGLAKGVKRVGVGDVRFTRGTALALAVALATAQRIGEVCGARWANVDLNDTAPVWLVPAEGVGAAKNREAHRVPLSPFAAALFREARDLAGDGAVWVFPGGVDGRPLDPHAPTRAVGRSRAAIGIENWRVHDLRRTAATFMGEAGVPEHHISLVLNHASARKGTITGKVYNQYQYDKEKRAALDVWGSLLSRIVDGSEAANVVPLRPATA